MWANTQVKSRQSAIICAFNMACTRSKVFSCSEYSVHPRYSIYMYLWLQLTCFLLPKKHIESGTHYVVQYANRRNSIIQLPSCWARRIMVNIKSLNSFIISEMVHISSNSIKKAAAIPGAWKWREPRIIYMYRGFFFKSFSNCVKNKLHLESKHKHGIGFSKPLLAYNFSFLSHGTTWKK